MVRARGPSPSLPPPSEGLVKQEGLNVSVKADYTSSQHTVSQIESGKAEIFCGDYVSWPFVSGPNRTAADGQTGLLGS